MVVKNEGSFDEKLLNLLLENSLEGVMLVDRHGIVCRVNQAFVTMTSLGQDSIESKSVVRMLKTGNINDFFDPIREGLWQDGFWQGDIQQTLVNDRIIKGFLKVSAVLPKSGPVRYYLCQLAEHGHLELVRAGGQAITARDNLTKLATLPVFTDRLLQAVANAHRQEQSVGVMILDLDRFHQVNDSLGTKLGDELLCLIAGRLTNCLRDSDSVARIGADEFGMLLSDIDEGPGAVRNSGFVAQKVYEALAQPVELGGKSIEVTAAVGITLFPQDGRNPEELLNNAKTALSHARQGSRNNYQFFSHKMADVARRRFALESSLREAVEGGQLHLYYQPQIDLKTGKIIGAEALLRWIHPEQGVISPVEFIPVAEETGLILPIGDWVIRTACRQVAIWRDMNLPPVRVGVNLSAVQFQRQDIEKVVKESLAETGIDPGYLDLEITESAIMDDVKKAVLILNRIGDMGVKLSIDDFGTGYSSLSQLRHFPFKTLKIDRSFVNAIANDEGDKAIVNAIIAMAHSLNQTVIVEGVETVAQLEIMQNLNCNEMQGYLFSAPVKVDKFTELLKNGVELKHVVEKASDPKTTKGR
ncbi:MAG: bifunctional diguanylate cyclase/phosphodiesterase [Magnetococcales bacterium]|nr:bifunctional diguanylate cyclase/phosphodiesterase [Magnetococcales bacterium]